MRRTARACWVERLVRRTERIGLRVWNVRHGLRELASSWWGVASEREKQVPQASPPGRDKFRAELQRRNYNSRASRQALERVVGLGLWLDGRSDVSRANNVTPHGC